MAHQVAETILNQLGRNRFAAMTGAKNFVGSATSLKFDIGSNPKKVKAVRITLSPDDLYTIEFFKKAKKDPVFGISVGYDVAARVDGVYVDMLHDVFTEHTGLYTRL